ncbi:MAG: 2-oxoacid:acceptor oxidoreductase family protein [Dehalococcoidales bacterium]
MDTNELIGIRWHGRGGQGAVTSAALVARAAINEGKFAQAFPSFGPERRGAPVKAFVRISTKEPIRIRAEITEPDIVVVFDPRLLYIAKVTSGLKEGGMLLINSRRSFEDIQAEFGASWRVAIIDATSTALELLGVAIVNTTMIGALIKATGVIKLESLFEPLKERFGRLSEKNINAMKRAYEETQLSR